MEEKKNYNSDKSKLIAENIWSEEIPAVVDGKTTLVSGFNNIFQSLFNRIKKVRTTFLERNIITGNGLSGGGNLSEDRVLSVEAKDNSIIVEPKGISVNKTDLLSVSNSGILASSKAVKELNDKLESHNAKKSNPHEVTKAQVGLGNVNNWVATSSLTNKSDTKFATASAIKSVNDKLESHNISRNNPHRVTKEQIGLGNVNNWVATSSLTDKSDTKFATASAIKSVNDKLESHNTSRNNPHRVTKEQIGLGNIINYPFSDKYKVLDGDGNKYSLQKSLKMMFDELKEELKEQNLIGEPIMTLCNTLPNNEDFGWCDGSQLKKTAYPRLWKRVERTVNQAVQKARNGELKYGVNYFGWYVGNSNEYFRKPNLNNTGYFMRPSQNRFVGHYEVDSTKKHTHKNSISSNGNHSHKGNTNQSGNHRHTTNFYVDGDDWGHGRVGLVDFNNDGYIKYSTTNIAGNHSHYYETNYLGNHTHSLSIYHEGEDEAKPKNIAVKYYCRIK